MHKTERLILEEIGAPKAAFDKGSERTRDAGTWLGCFLVRIAAVTPGSESLPGFWPRSPGQVF